MQVSERVSIHITKLGWQGGENVYIMFHGKCKWAFHNKPKIKQITRKRENFHLYLQNKWDIVFRKNILAHCHHCFSTFFSIRQKENSILLKTKAEWLKGFSCRIIQVYYILRGIKNNKKKSNENKGSWQMKSLTLHWLIKPQFTSKTLLPIHIALETKRLFRDHENTHLRPSRLYRNLTTNVDWLLECKNTKPQEKMCSVYWHAVPDKSCLKITGTMYM